MFLKTLINTILITYSVQKAHGDDKAYNMDLQKMQIFGSGCGEGSVNVISSTDGNTVTILFSEYFAETFEDDTFDRKSCNLAIPFNINPDKQVGLYAIDYRGYTYVPEEDGSETTFQIEYFFAGLKGPIVKRTYEEEEDIVISDKVPLLWSPCGGSEIFRINTSIRARKGSKDADDPFITIDSVDGTEDNTIALMYYFQEQDC